jgi:hypothetical protein
VNVGKYVSQNCLIPVFGGLILAGNARPPCAREVCSVALGAGLSIGGAATSVVFGCTVALGAGLADITGVVGVCLVTCGGLKPSRMP